MKSITLYHLRTAFFMSLVIILCLSACHVPDQSKDNRPSVDSFQISPDATVTDEHGVKQKLSDILVPDSSTLVLRVTDRQLPGSVHIVLYRVRFITDEYPPTKRIIILADQLPGSSGPLGQPLRSTSLKMRVFKIDSSFLPPAIESKQLAYAFYLNKKLQASNVFIPTDLYSGETDNYFQIAGAGLGREQINPLIEHTKGMHTSTNSSGSDAGLYLSNRRVSAGLRNINITYYEDFYFRNNGREPLVIHNITNNWNRYGCNVDVPDRSIAPGEHARIRVSYRLWKTGSFRNEIKVYSNASGSPHTLVISGTGISTASRTSIIGTTRYRRY